MKKSIPFLLLICFLFITNFSLAQSSDWLWAKASTGGDAEGFSVCSGPSGEVYATGYFDGATISFGSILLNNAGGGNSTQDIFLVKYDASGNVIWAIRAGGGGSDFASSVSTDKSGNVYLTGIFGSSSITFGSFTLSNLGIANGFVVKYDPAGNAVWANRIGANQTDYGMAINVDVLDDVYVTGCFTSPSITIGSTALTNNSGAGIEDIFICKYDASGNVIWAKSAGGTGSEISSSIAADALGNVCVTGSFKSPTLVFGSSTLTHVGMRDIFIVNYNASGNVMWAKSAGAGLDDAGCSVSDDPAGNIFVSGYFEGAISFGSLSLTGSIDKDIFIVKYDPSGNERWAHTGKGPSGERGYSVSADPLGNVYLSGSMTDSIVFSPITFTAPPNHNDAVFLMEFDSSGNIMCGSTLSSGGDDIYSISADHAGNVFLSSDYEMSTAFIIGNDTLPLDPTGENIYVAKYSCTSQVGVQERMPISGIEIFPNPSNGKFTIENSAEEKIKSVKVYNALGEMILEIKNQEQQLEIDLSSQANGLYFICIETEKGIETSKLMLSK